MEQKKTLEEFNINLEDNKIYSEIYITNYNNDNSEYISYFEQYETLSNFRYLEVYY